MGYAMRTDRYRYVEWLDQKTRETKGRELYDHQADPGENVNLAGGQAGQQELVSQLSAQLQAGWKAAMPKR
jgi:hypothetical protein